jgi:hypothetical protein
MTCCDEQGHNCQQGKKCIRRVRAGQPPPEGIWKCPDPAEWEKEANEQWYSDLKSILFVASCTLAFFLIVWSSL